MKNSIFVAMIKAMKQLLNEALYLWLRELEARSCNETRKVMFHVFEDKIQALRYARCYNPLKLYDIWMIQCPKDFDFSSHKAHALRVHVDKPHLF